MARPGKTASAWLEVIVTVLFLASCARAQDGFEVYVLAVGSSYYVTPTEPGEQGLAAIPGANKGARAVVQRFIAGGARYGVLVTAQDGGYVSLNDIQTALKRVTAAMAADHPRHPLLVVYIAGHGISEGFGWNHYSVPGDFVFKGEPEALKLADLTGYALHAGTFADQLTKIGVPFLLLLDACYSGTPALFESPVLSAQNSQAIGDIAAALRKMNELRQANPVIFSATPGESQPTVDDPSASGPDPVAPLARRLMLMVDSKAKGEAITLSNLVTDLQASDLDDKTHPAVTHAEPALWWNRVLIQSVAAGGRLDEAKGTAIAPHLCCALSATTEPKPIAVQGVVNLSGGPGDFITGGHNQRLATPAAALTLAEPEDGEAKIHVGPDNSGWTIALAPPKGQRLQAGLYLNVQREGFQDAGRPGLEISGPSTGCNEISGSFRVTSVSYDAAGKLTSLEFSAQQICDDEKMPLDATVKLARR